MKRYTIDQALAILKDDTYSNKLCIITKKSKRLKKIKSVLIHDVDNGVIYGALIKTEITRLNMNDFDFIYEVSLDDGLYNFFTYTGK